MIDRSFDHLMINRTNSLGSIGQLSDPLILSRSIEIICLDQSFDPIMINQTNSLGLIG
jgi:hypothetical protein